MKRLISRMHRTVMLSLAFMPVTALIFRAILSSFWAGPVWLVSQTLVAAVLTLLPAYIGNYREYEVVTYEGGRGSDPNPDREATHTLVKEGTRFPLRLSADLIVLLIGLVLMLLAPRGWFKNGTLLNRFIFIGVMTLIQLYAMRDLPSAAFIWEDIPGIFIGAVFYLGCAIYLQVTDADVSVIRTLISLSAVAYLFFAGVALNRQSILSSMSAHADVARKAPKQIVVRNRTIVLGFASLVTVVSLIEPIQKGILWLLARAADFARMIGRLLGGGKEAPQELPTDLMGGMQTAEMAAEAAPEAYEPSFFEDLVVYGFLALLAAAAVWMLWDRLRALAKKLSNWMEKFAMNIGEGFYDEKEELMSAEEARDQLKNMFKERLKAMFTREKPWGQLDGRERARRLLKEYYKKRAKKVENLRAKTAREAVYLGDYGKADAERFVSAYDRARYSQREVSEAEMDEIKKDLRL